MSFLAGIARRGTWLALSGGLVASLVLMTPAHAERISASSAGFDAPRTVVRQFYTWYMNNPEAQMQRTPISWNPVRRLFDGEFFWMLGELRAEHPRARPKKGYDCALDADPFGLGSAGGNVVRFTVGAVGVRGDTYVVPVRLFIAGGKATMPGGPPHVSDVALAVKNEGGSYRIYDFAYRPTDGAAYSFGLRSELMSMAHDPLCAWFR